LEGHRARKGVFITTSDYSQDAINYVSLVCDLSGRVHT
jgi:restriction endonuclease Mrr